MSPGFNLDFRRSTFFGFGANRSFERYSNINFQHTGYGFGMHTEYFKKATVDFNLEQGTRLVYGPAGNLAPFRGDGRNLTSTLTFRPISRLKLDEIYYYTSLHTRTDSFAGVVAPVTAKANVFTNHLIRSRLNYQFNKELSLRFIVDYNATLPNTSLVNFTKTKAISGDVLLTYLLHPGKIGRAHV